MEDLLQLYGGPDEARLEKLAIGFIVVVNPSKVVVIVVDCDAPFGTVQPSPRLSLIR
jgi:hypothetical protein